MVCYAVLCPLSGGLCGLLCRVMPWSGACVSCLYTKGTLTCRGSTRVYPVESFALFNIVLNIIPTLYEGYIVSVHRMVKKNRPVDPGSIQGSQRSISFIRIKHTTRTNGFFFCKTEY